MRNTKNTVNTVREATARLLATENITVIEDPKAPSAYFDLKSRTLGLPVWKDITQEMYDMLVGHEVGHALFTPNGNGGWVESAKRIAADAGFAGDREAEAAAQSFLNVVEDARIERLIKERYPGLRRDFFTAYTEFAKRDIFKIGGRPLSGFGLADRLNIHFKIGFTQPVPFSPSERQFVNRMETAVTWEEVVAIANDLFEFESNPQGNQGQGSTPSNPGEGEEGEEGSASGSGKGEGNETGQSGKGKADDQTSGESGTGDADGEGESQGESQSEGTDASGNDGDSESQSDGDTDINDTRDGSTTERTRGHGVNTAPVKPRTAQTAGSLDKASSDLRDHNARGRNYLYIPRAVKPEGFVIPFGEFIGAMRQWEASGLKNPAYGSDPKIRKRSIEAVDKQIRDLVEDTRGSIQAFVREFEMLKTADEHRRTVESKSGRLDMDQAWKYRISEDLFKVATTMRDGKNHGFVMFIDWSGSMQPNMEQTMRQLYILFQFCKKVGIPFDVYAFGIGLTDRSMFPSLEETGRKANRLVLDDKRNEVNPDVELLHIMSSRANARDLQDAFRYCLCATSYGYGDYPPVTLGGSTPLDSTVVVARDIVNEFRKGTKVQIVNTVFLTDGDATDGLCNYGTKGHQHYAGPTILRDGHREWASENAMYSGGTALLLQWFKANTGANLVGIFVAGRFGHATHHIDPSMKQEDRALAEKQFKSDGWCSVKGLGFDQYFVLRGNVVDTEKAMDEFEQRDGGTMTATQIKNAYMKAVESRNGARGMIHRFVKTVA